MRYTDEAPPRVRDEDALDFPQVKRPIQFTLWGAVMDTSDAAMYYLPEDMLERDRARREDEYASGQVVQASVEKARHAAAQWWDQWYRILCPNGDDVVSGSGYHALLTMRKRFEAYSIEVDQDLEATFPPIDYLGNLAAEGRPHVATVEEYEAKLKKNGHGRFARAQVALARFSVLNLLIWLFEHDGIVGSWHDLEERGGIGDIDLTLSPRAAQYASTALRLLSERKPYSSWTDLFKDVSTECPKPDGEPPEVSAVFGCLEGARIYRKGSTFPDDLQRFARSARARLGLRGDGQAGAPPALGF